MNINQDNINEVFNRYKSFVDTLSFNNGYDSNITHLLYVIVPSFVIRYGLDNEKLILNCFNETKIEVTNRKEESISAFFVRDLYKDNSLDYEAYKTNKFIVINDYNNTTYINMIDSIIHEFNHAINSINNEISFDDKYIKLRTGISYVKYDKNNLINAIEKDKSYVLEEIVNTKQTEEIFDIIIDLSKYSINDIEINNMISMINKEVGSNNYKSDAYGLQSYICKELIKNKTFIPTIEKLRLSGETNDFDSWFDNIVGKEGTFERLIDLLSKEMDLERKYSITKIFRGRVLNKIKAVSRSIIEITNDFDKASVYK